MSSVVVLGSNSVGGGGGCSNGEVLVSHVFSPSDVRCNRRTNDMVAKIFLPTATPSCDLSDDSLVVMTSAVPSPEDQVPMKVDIPSDAHNKDKDNSFVESTSVSNFLWCFIASLFEMLCSIFSLLGHFLVAVIPTMRYVLLGQLLLVELQGSGKGNFYDDNIQSASAVPTVIHFFRKPAAKAAASWFTASCLALFAFASIALYHYPHGLPWIALWRRIRELFMSLLHSSTTCWAWLVNDDTGAIATFLALATFGTLFFFCYVLHRTLAPKQPRLQNQKKSRTPSSYNTGESQLGLSAQGATLPYNPEQQQALRGSTEQPSPSRKRKKKKNSGKKRGGNASAVEDPCITPAQVLATTREEIPTRNLQSSAAHINASPTTSSPPRLNETRLSLPPQTPPTVSSSGKRTSNYSGVPNAVRLRVESTSTTDTASSSTLWEEDSVVSSASSSPHQPPHVPKQQQQRNQNRSSKRVPSSTYSSPSHNSNNLARSTGSSETASCDLVVSSRWDVLKPAPPSIHSVHPPPRNMPKKVHNKSPNNGNVTRQNRGVRNASPAKVDQQQGPDRHLSAPVSFSMPESEFVSTSSQSRSSAEFVSHNDSTLVINDKVRSLLNVPNEPVVKESRNQYVQPFFSTATAPLFPPSQPSPSQLQPMLSPNASFFSDLNPRTMPYAPAAVAPPKVLRAPPGLGLPEHFVNLPPTNESSSTNSSFFSMPSSPYPRTSFGTPSGWMGVPSGNSSPLLFRPTSNPLAENPFFDDEEDALIEAELQELGGRMIGSILDF